MITSDAEDWARAGPRPAITTQTSVASAKVRIALRVMGARKIAIRKSGDNIGATCVQIVTSAADLKFQLGSGGTSAASALAASSSRTRVENGNRAAVL